MNYYVLQRRSLLIFGFIFILQWLPDEAFAQRATLDPDNEFTYTFLNSFHHYTFGKTMHVQFEKDEITLDGNNYKKLKFNIKSSFDIPYDVKDYLYREDGFKIFRRFGDTEELFIDYNAKIGDKFLNDKWKVVQIGMLDGKKIVVVETPYGFVRWIEGSGGDLPFFVEASNGYNFPGLCKMINYTTEQEYYNDLICKKSEIKIKYIDPSHLWKYYVPGIFNNQDYSYYTKILPDTTILNQKKYFRGSTYSVSSQNGLMETRFTENLVVRYLSWLMVKKL